MVLASACENKSRHVVAKTSSKLLENIFASVTMAGDVVEFAPPPFFFVISFFLLSCSVFGFCHPLLLHLFSRLRFLVLRYISHSTLIALPPTEVGTVSCESLCVSCLCFSSCAFCVCFVCVCLFRHTSCQISRRVFLVSCSSLRVANGAATRPGFPCVCVALLLVVHIGRFPAYFSVSCLSHASQCCPPLQTAYLPPPYVFSSDSVHPPHIPFHWNSYTPLRYLHWNPYILRTSRFSIFIRN